MRHYDLAVIGTGPAGQKAAIQAAKLGKSVAIIEKNASLGGAAINTGTIPSKALREAVMHLTGASKRDDIIQLADKTIQPEWLVHAHWAVCGFCFIKGDYLGKDHAGDVFFAAHGSWNSIKPVGAVVQRLMFDKLTGKPYGSQTIVDCVGPDRRLSRPVDCVEAPDGTILFSSDEPSGVFRISRSNSQSQ